MSSTAVSAIGIGILSLLLAGYIAQNRLPPPKPKIVGIDFGTTYSAIGVYIAISGTAQVIADSNGRKTIPSVIHYKSHEDIVIGYEALEKSEKDSLNVIYDAKRFIGRNASLSDLAKESEHYNFKILKENETICFEVLSNKNRTCLSPEKVASFIINHLKRTAEKNLSVSVNKAVMSVPADFNEAQRNFTKKAAKLAGIDVLRIINEPTAAALAYGMHKKNGTNFVMVIDIGGGTSDISLLNIQGGMFVTTAMAGNNRLGGQDFNQNLFDHLENLIASKYGDELLKSSENYQRLRIGVEKLKLDLTYSSSATIRLNLVKTASSETIEFSHMFTQKEFNDLNLKLFNKITELIEVVLKSAEMNLQEVDDIVLVGGSTRIPKVREIIAAFFNKKPNVSIDPETAVIEGVAIQAGIIGGMWPLQVSAIEIHRSGIKKINVN